MYLFYLVSLILTVLMMISSHPVAITALVLSQTLNICLIAWSAMKVSWFAYILFLIFLGGLMVLFIYITSLASNEKFEMNIDEMKISVLKITAIVLAVTPAIFFLKEMSTFNVMFSKMIKFLFSTNSLIIIISVISYLLLTLLVAVSVASMFEGPMRNLMMK